MFGNLDDWADVPMCMFLGLILPIKIPVRELTPAGIIITHGGWLCYLVYPWSGFTYMPMGMRNCIISSRLWTGCSMSCGMGRREKVWK